MSSEWQRSELGKEAFNASRPFSFKTHPQVVFVNTGDVLQGKFLHKNISNGAGLPGQAKKALKQDDILLTEIRPGNGRYAFVDFPAEKYVVSTKFMVIESHGRVIPRFLYHVLTNQSALDEFQRIAESRSGTFPQITFDSIEHFPVPVPPPAVQEELAGFFDAIDDRITLLRETNTTLEAIAQALFKSWFVDFDPVHAKMQGRAPEGMDEATAALFPDSFEESELGAVPKGWKWMPLNDVYEINPTRKLKKGDTAAYLDMAGVQTQGHSVSGVVQREMGSGTKFMNGDTLLARITPCLENGKTAFVDFLPTDQTGWGSTEFVVLRPKAPLPQYHAYLLARHPAFREHAIRSMSGTSGRQRIQNDVLSQFPVAVPNEPIAKAFSELVLAVQESIQEGHQQAGTLSELRDTLLPRLISGQLSLSNVEEFTKVEAVSE
jgi:type I restriction enzyme, S subunit